MVGRQQYALACVEGLLQLLDLPAVERMDVEVLPQVAIELQSDKPTPEPRLDGGDELVRLFKDDVLHEE